MTSVRFFKKCLCLLQTGDFRTRISVYDLEDNERAFDSERVLFQYEHNYWKLPVAMDDTSVIHTSGTVPKPTGYLSCTMMFGYRVALKSIF